MRLPTAAPGSPPKSVLEDDRSGRRGTVESGMSISMSDHLNYIQTLPTSDAVRRQRAASERRFVAGAEFFNYRDLGSLRPGLPTIRLFSREYIGLAIHVVLIGFTFHFFSYGYGRLLAQYLKANSERQVLSANYVLVWPQALSIFIGLVSDCFPIRGYRRKSYMIIGWIISFLAYVTLIILDQYGDSGRKLFKTEATRSIVDTSTSDFAPAFIIVSLIAGTGIQVGWIAAMAAGVEYAQREHLHYRGRLQCTLLALNLMGGLVGYIVIACLITGGDDGEQYFSTISLGIAAIILAVVSLMAIPVVVILYAEEKYAKAGCGHIAVRHQIAEFWRFCHQNVVYRVLFFIIAQLFFIGLFNQNVRDAVRVWSDATIVDSVVGDVPRVAIGVVSVVVWNSFLRNTSWRKLAVIGSSIYIATHVVLTVAVTYDLVRDKLFYTTMMALTEFPRAWLLIFAVILATEIADAGREALTLSLGISYRTLAGLADFTIASILPKIMGFEVSMDEVAADESSTRKNVIAAFCIMLGFNLVSYFLILTLPNQKLDAQQLRAFGGYNRFASYGLLVIFVVLLVFNLTANLIVVL